MHREDASPMLLTPGKLCLSIACLSLILFAFVRIEFLAISASLFLSLYLFALLFGKASLKGLRAKIEVSDDRARAGDRLKAHLAVYNRNRFLPIFYPLIEVCESGHGQIQRFHLPQCLAPKSEVQLPIYPRIQERGRQNLSLRYGLSYFPVRIAEIAQRISSTSEHTIVWPRLPRTKRIQKTRPPRNENQDQGSKRKQQDQTAYPSHIREYQAGDPRRSISWRLSAKLDKLLVAERNSKPNRKYILVLDTSEKEWRNFARFERLLSVLSQLIGDFLRQHKLHSVVLNGKHYPLSSRDQYIRFMDALSVSSQQDPSTRLETHKGFHYLFIKADKQRRFKLVEQRGGFVSYI